MKTYYVRNVFATLGISIAMMGSSIAVANHNHAISKIVFFGDSVSDNGNLYQFDFGLLPKSPPYYAGQFSNHLIWSERVAAYFTDHAGIESANYAVGGETAILHNPTNGYLPYSLYASISSYLIRNILSDKDNTLFIIFIGANDYLNGVNNVDAETNAVVDNIKASIERLVYYGGKYFLIVNLPELSRSPMSQEKNMGEILRAVTEEHNKKLADAIHEVQSSYKSVNINLYDVNQLFNEVFVSPETFNLKHQTHFTNTTSYCWSGGYTLKYKQNEDVVAIAKRMEYSFNNTLRQQSANDVHTRAIKGIAANQQAKFDIKEFANYAASNPDLRETFTIMEAAVTGQLPCLNPDEYVFWDHIHPTAAMHEVMSKEMIMYIDSHY